MFTGLEKKLQKKSEAKVSKNDNGSSLKDSKKRIPKKTRKFVKKTATEQTITELHQNAETIGILPEDKPVEDKSTNEENTKKKPSIA